MIFLFQLPSLAQAKVVAGADELSRTIRWVHIAELPDPLPWIAFTIRRPLGVVGAITPFNFPFNLVAHKVGPAIAAGNTVVLKPAGQTPLSSLVLGDIFAEAGLPAGALNIIPGPGAVVGEKLVRDDRIKARHRYEEQSRSEADDAGARL